MVTVVMNGLPRAGKTTTKERLVGLPLKELSPSTGVVEPSLKVTITKLPRSSAMISGGQWTLLSLDDESLHLVETILQAAGNLRPMISTSFCDQLFHSSVFKRTTTNPISLPSSSGASKQLPPSQSTSPQQNASKATYS